MEAAPNSLPLLAFKSLGVLGLGLFLWPVLSFFERQFLSLWRRRLSRTGQGHWGPVGSFSHFFKLLIKEESSLTAGKSLGEKCLPFLYFQFSALPLCAMSFFGPRPDLGSRFFPPEILPSPYGLLLVYLLLSLVPAFRPFLMGKEGQPFSLLKGVRHLGLVISSQGILLLTLVALLFFYQEADVHKIVSLQSGHLLGGIPRWGLFLFPLGGLLFFTGILILNSKACFNLSHFKFEIPGGSYGDFSSLQYAFILLSEYLFLFGWLWLFSILFLGGYAPLPGFSHLQRVLPGAMPLLELLSLWTKMGAVYFLISLIQIMVPVVKMEQLLFLSWKIFFPLAFVNFICAGLWRLYELGFLGRGLQMISGGF